VSRRAAFTRQASTTARVVRAVLRNPALRRVFAAFLLFNAVEFGTWVAMLLFAYDATGPASVGVVALVQLLPAALFAPVAAAIGDRFPRQRVLLAGYSIQALAFGVTAAGMLGGAPAPLVYVAAACAAASLTLTRPAQGSLLPLLARTPEELTAANGLSGSVEGAGVLLGPLAAAAILVAGSPGTVFVVGAVGALVATLLVARLPAGRSSAVMAHVAGDDHLAGQVNAGVLAGLQVLARHADTRLVVALLALRMFITGALDVLFVLLALEVLRTGESGAGILNAALGLGTLVGGALTFALVGRPRLAPALALSGLLFGLSIMALGLPLPVALAPVLIALGGIGSAATDVAGRTILQRATPDEVLSRILGALEGIGLAALAAGSIIVPVIVAVVGVAAAPVVVGLVLPVGVVVALAGLRSIDRRVHVPVRELAQLRAVPVFAPLPPPQLEAVAGRARWITVEAGEVLIREGDRGDRYYVLESGRMRITRGGIEQRIAQGPADGFGEIALLRDVPRTATITALEPCVLLALERHDFLEAVTGHEQAHEIVQQTAAERSITVGAPADDHR